MVVEAKNDTDMKGHSKHGFKKHKSTTAAGLTLQSAIANYV